MLSGVVRRLSLSSKQEVQSLLANCADACRLLEHPERLRPAQAAVPVHLPHSSGMCTQLQQDATEAHPPSKICTYAALRAGAAAWAAAQVHSWRILRPWPTLHGIWERLLLTTHLPWQPNVLKRKRTHGFLKRSALLEIPFDYCSMLCLHVHHHVMILLRKWFALWGLATKCAINVTKVSASPRTPSHVVGVGARS